jgi:hypothetical protein
MQLCGELQVKVLVDVSDLDLWTNDVNPFLALPSATIAILAFSEKKKYFKRI